jgi:dolichol-phosphate mannosyltransferase
MAMAAEIAEAQSIQVPITFIERTNGKSKMNGWIAIEALKFITKNGIKRVLSRPYRR